MSQSSVWAPFTKIGKLAPACRAVLVQLRLSFCFERREVFTWSFCKDQTFQLDGHPRLFPNMSFKVWVWRGATLKFSSQ